MRVLVNFTTNFAMSLATGLTISAAYGMWWSLAAIAVVTVYGYACRADGRWSTK